MSCDCGVNCDCWGARRFRESRSDSQFWQAEHVRMTARVAQLETELKLRDHRDRTDVAWLQAKVVAQRREIKRLNDDYNARRLRGGVDPVPDVEPEHANKVEVDSRMHDAITAGKESS